MKNKIIKSFLALSVLFLASCSENLLDPTLAQSSEQEKSINSPSDLRIMMNGAYNYMSLPSYWGRDLVIFGEVRSDNTFSNGFSGRFVITGSMSLSPSSTDVEGVYRYASATIGNCNIIINSNLVPIDSEEEDQIAQVKAEAYVIRALAHFDMVRLYGQQHVAGQGGMDALGVPYVTEFKGNLNPPRNTVAEVKEKIYEDIDTAIDLFVDGLANSAKTEITKDAAYAIKSRVATYFGDSAIAKTACEAIINKYEVTPREKYIESFSSISAPANSIFELLVLENDNNGINSLNNIYGGQQYGDIQVINQFVADAGFDSDDIRISSEMLAVQGGKLRNIGKYGNDKFTDNIKVIRYEEVVLNYAEALLATDPGAALVQLNRIVAEREATPNLYTVANIDNILIERRKELCFEGFRFDDLARTNRDIPVIGTQQTHRGPAYGSYKYAFPIPQHEMNANTEMDQNEGYNY